MGKMKNKLSSLHLFGDIAKQEKHYMDFFSHINLVALTQTKYPSHGFPCNVVQAVMVNRKGVW